MKDVYGLGVVGYGHFGAITAEEYARVPQIKIAGVAESDPERRRMAADRFAVPTYEGLDDLLDNSEVEIVVLNTPPWLHGPQALRAAQARKHLFVEKPLATSLAQARQVLDVVAQHSLKLSVNYVMRHVSLYQKAHALAVSGLFGKLLYLALENDAANEALRAGHWFWDRAKSGGIFVEHGVHFFDLCNSLAQSAPERIAGFGSSSDGVRQDRVLASVRYTDGALATFSHCFDRLAILEWTRLRLAFERALVKFQGWIPDVMELEGELPAAQLDELAGLLNAPLDALDNVSDQSNIIVRATLRVDDRTAEYRGAVRAGMEDLVRAIREPDYTPLVTAEDAFSSLALALAAQNAIDTEPHTGAPQEGPTYVG
jgi:predicted dehydrogenase